MAISPFQDMQSRRAWWEHIQRLAAQERDSGAWPGHADIPVGWDERDAKGV